MRDLHHNIGAVNALPPQHIASSTVSGSIVNLSGFDAVEFIVTAGAIVDGGYSVTLTESNASNMANGDAPASSSILGSLPYFNSASANTAARFGYVGVAQYLQLTVTPVGATSGGTFAAVAIEGKPLQAPVP